MTRALRTTLTLAVLALVLVIGAVWGFSAVTAPFPGKADAPACVDTKYSTGDTVSPQDVTVSVINASKREGLAGRTMQLLHDAGFAEGQTQNAPKGTEVGSAEIWVTDRSDPAIKLLRSRIGKVPVRKRSDIPAVGLVLVVGDQFGSLTSGLPSVVLKKNGVVCSPPVN